MDASTMYSHLLSVIIVAKVILSLKLFMLSLNEAVQISMYCFYGHN